MSAETTNRKGARVSTARIVANSIVEIYAEKKPKGRPRSVRGNRQNPARNQTREAGRCEGQQEETGKVNPAAEARKKMSIGERGIWHESGHSVVALSLGSPAADIWFKNGNFEATHNIAHYPEVSLHHIYAVLAAGAASEKLKFGDYNLAGSSADAARISELGGTTIEDYLPEATEILEAHRHELEMMVGELRSKYAQSFLNERPNPFRVMSAEEVDAIHKAATRAETKTP